MTAILFSILILAQTGAQEVRTTPIYREIAEHDTAMFTAFNAHDLPALMAYFSDGLEFYHGASRGSSVTVTRLVRRKRAHIRSGH